MRALQLRRWHGSIEAEVRYVAHRHEIPRDDGKPAHAVSHHVDKMRERFFGIGAHRTERAKQRSNNDAGLNKRQSAKTAQVFCEDDGIRRILTGVEVAIDVEKHHGLARLQHDAADAVTGGKRDALMPLACRSRAVHPLQRRAGELSHADGDEIKPKIITERLSHAKKCAAFARQFQLGEMQERHGHPLTIALSGMI